MLISDLLYFRIGLHRMRGEYDVFWSFGIDIGKWGFEWCRTSATKSKHVVRDTTYREFETKFGYLWWQCEHRPWWHALEFTIHVVPQCPSIGGEVFVWNQRFYYCLDPLGGRWCDFPNNKPICSHHQRIVNEEKEA